jgi:putative ABC transport system permease protein
MGSLTQDLRHGFRLLSRSPGFALAAVAVLALGIGANTAIFSVVNAVLLEPLPFPHPERLVRVWHVPPANAFPGFKKFAVSAANYLDWEKQNTVFEKMSIVGYRGLTMTGTAEPEAVPAARVSPDFFSVLGARPILGRAFTRQDDSPGSGHVVVLSHGFWKSHFGGEKEVVGREVRFDGEPWTIIGVMGPEVTIPDFSRVWVPTAWDAKQAAVRNNHNFTSIARLKPGIDIRRAQAEMNVLSDRLARQYPEDNAEWGAVVVPLKEDMVGDVRPLLLVLLAAVVFVLLIACANVANLMLARTVARRKEIAVRSALGASRARLLRQLVVEALLLSLAGGALGVLLASFGISGITKLLADEIPRSTAISVNAAVLVFASVISVVTGVLAGLAPAWQATKTNLSDSLKQGLGRSDSDDSGGRARSLLVVSEVALSLVLLIGAGLLIRSLWLLQKVNPGFDARGVTTLTLEVPRKTFEEDKARTAAFFDRVLERLRALPGVETVGGVNSLPLTGTSNWPIQIEGRPPLPVSKQPNVVTSTVSGDIWRALRITVKRGRVFTAADNAGAPGVIVINEAMAKRFWPGEDPMGKRLTTAFASEEPRQVVGIVADVKYNGLEVREPVAAMYIPLAQSPSRAMDFAIRTNGRAIAAAAVAAVAAVHEIDPNLPVLQVGSMEQVLAASLVRQRFGMILLASFAGLALALAAVGIYSVLSYTVRHRGREIGIRMALGAQVKDVVRLIVVQGMRPALLGMAIGLAAALALGRTISSLVFGVTAADPLTLGAVAALLSAVALAACLLPAMRATRVDPIRALRED